MLRINKDKTAPEWIDPYPRLRENVLALKSLTAPKKPAVRRCKASESMNDFYLLEDASGQGFGLCLWDHEGMIYNSENWLKQWKNETSNWKEGTYFTVRVEELAEEHKLENG